MVKYTDKDKHEMDILARTIEIGLKKEGLTKQVLSKIQKEYQKYERPDFLFFVNETIIGVEHYSVHHKSSIQDNGKIGSVVKQMQGRANYIAKKYADLDWSQAAENIAFLKEFEELLDYSIGSIHTDTYQTFIESFDYSFTDHSKKTTTYIDNIRNTNPEMNVELYHLVEIHTSFLDYYVKDDDGFNNKRFTPIFSDMVLRICNNVYIHDIDYIIFSFFEDDDIYDVVVFKPDRMVSDIHDQNKNIYTYAGYDFELEAFKVHEPVQKGYTISKIGESFDIIHGNETLNSKTMDYLMSNTIRIFNMIIHLESENKVYVTDKYICTLFYLAFYKIVSIYHDDQVFYKSEEIVYRESLKNNGYIWYSSSCPY